MKVSIFLSVDGNPLLILDPRLVTDQYYFFNQDYKPKLLYQTSKASLPVPSYTSKKIKRHECTKREKKKKPKTDQQNTQGASHVDFLLQTGIDKLLGLFCKSAFRQPRSWFSDDMMHQFYNGHGLSSTV